MESEANYKNLEAGRQVDEEAACNTTDCESSTAEDYDLFAIERYESAEYALLSYSRTNKLAKLQTLLDAKLRNDLTLDLNFKGQQKQNFSWSALHLACYFGHEVIVQIILSKRQLREELDINVQNVSGDTPLHKAALTNRAQIVQTLLSNGASVFIKNCDGLTAKMLTTDPHVLNMLEAAEQADLARIVRDMFKTVDNGDLDKLRDHIQEFSSSFDRSPATLEPDGTERESASNSSDDNKSTEDRLSKMVDERGNSLLHLATMRGFKAICVYLLEQGLDPYRKNNLGQSCIDLASYQLRQLFTSVRPANNQLKKISNQRVGRFEGPIMKKVRILGWKQIYAVLDNGAILLFNNKRDSMNRSRKGYKYLESAICEVDPNNLGAFTISFSDRSKATFLVTSAHLNSYISYKIQQEQEKTSDRSNQIDLIRQKWLNAIKDHIDYSTNFIRSGLRVGDEEDNEVYREGGDLTELNHLLPIDTIKSFVQEARAHYSILERHAESLCSLMQTIATNDRFIDQAMEDEEPSRGNTLPVGGSSGIGSGNRLVRLIRSSRLSKGSINEGEQYATGVVTDRRRNNSLTNEFMQDSWHCILFHLRLLMESSENTKTSMGQALALMEHQEQLRQNRIQDQEERCRVLEDSLHALARDHHELEKTFSYSQVYHSASAGIRSTSMSTDLNEYFDAFEDFDDEKTMTPTSMPSDDELDQEDTRHHMFRFNRKVDRGQPNQPASLEDDESDEDDVRSNCSALTVATNSDFVSNPYLKDSSSTRANDGLGSSFEQSISPRHRTRLPSPMVPKDYMSIWSILKNCIGKELSKITMPVVFNEPLTMLQRACEGIQFSYLLKMADLTDDPIERLEFICAFIVASLSGNCNRIMKPFNPLLYETYEFEQELDDGTMVRAVSQQVSHHPPITAVCAESDYFIHNHSVNPKIKFWGRTIEIQPDGQCKIYLKRHKETYVFKSVSCSIHNIIVGKIWFEHWGPIDIKCLETDMQANLMFRKAGWFSNDIHRFDGFISAGQQKKKFLYGKWSDYIKSADIADYESFMRENQQKVFRPPDHPIECNGLNNNSITNHQISSNNDSNKPINQIGPSSTPSAGDKFVKQNAQLLDMPNSRVIWKLNNQYLEEYYSFTLFTMRLNELTPELEKSIAKTDSRHRLDVRKLEEGDLDAAANEKQRLEDKQRAARAKDKRFKNPSSDFLWFDLVDSPTSKDKYWSYKGGYWEKKCNPEIFPDLF